MNQINTIFDKISSPVLRSIITSLVIVGVSFLLYKAIAFIFVKGGNNKVFKNITHNKSQTYMRMTRSIVRYIFIIITVLILLQINGINVSSMLAGVGVAGIVIGFAIQDMLKDIIKGFDILSEGYFRIGDYIKFNNIEGKVVSIGLKTTKIEDMNSFNIVSIANRNIDQVQLMSDLLIVKIPMPYDMKVEAAEEVMQDLINRILQIDDVNLCNYAGVNEFKDSYVDYRINVRCNPANRVQVNRDILRQILLVFEEHGLSVPYPQLDIHNA